jgi:hypothetical protein
MDLKFKSGHLMCLRSALLGFPGIIATIRRRKAILSLSRWRERVGVRVGLDYIPLTFVLSPMRLCHNMEKTDILKEWRGGRVEKI